MGQATSPRIDGLDQWQDWTGYAKPYIVSSYGTVTGYKVIDPEADESNDESQYPPPDRGRAAWVFLAGCFWLEGLVWGIVNRAFADDCLPFSYGVFAEYYSNHEVFSSETGVAAIGTTALVQSSADITAYIGPSDKRLSNRVYHTSSAPSSSPSSNDGVLFGIGGALIYNPFIFYLDEWFIERKGLAYGVFWAGQGAVGSVAPFIMHWALNQYGFRTTLRAWGIFLCNRDQFINLAVLIRYMGPRKPVSAQQSTQELDLGFLKTPLYWIFEIGSIIEGFSYFVPQIYVPIFAHSTPTIPSHHSVLATSLLNLTATFGLILTGYLTDHFPLKHYLLLSALFSSLTVFLLWGFATTTPLLYAFVILFALSAGGFTASWSAM
ncbi:MAG: hypothetical protein Q9174_005307, partial [Haloplaca sp. 1 TL-2023]